MSRGFRSIVIAAGVLIPSLFLVLMLASTPRPVHVAPAAAPPPVPGNPAAAENAAQARAENAAAARERDWARSADHPSGAEAVAKQQPASRTRPASQATLNADADAKSNARNLVSQVEVCWITKHTYAGCANASSNLPIGTGSGQVSATAANATSYTVTARSTAGQTFVIARSGPGSLVHRSCTPAGRGGCPATEVW